MRAQESQESAHIKIVPDRRIGTEIFLCQKKQSHRRPQAAAMFGMSWMLEIFLQMDKSASALNEAFEEIVVARFGVEPNLFEHIVRFVVTLLVPTLKKSAVIRMIRNHGGPALAFTPSQLADQLRNPLAFAHEELTLVAAQAMSKPSGHTSSKDERALFRSRSTG
jgi:hypothetical protein